MSTAFDPYHIWLGIPPEEQPPHHYRLLGVPRFETNLDVIEAAADRQMTFLRHHGAGPHGDASQKLLNEVSRAQVELLNPKKKAAYDERLRQTLAAAAADHAADADGADDGATAVAPQFPFAPSDAELAMLSAPGLAARRPKNRAMIAVVCGLFCALLGAGLGTYPLWSADKVPDDGSVEIKVTAKDGAVVWLDGDTVPADRLAAPLPAAAGRHTVELKRRNTLLATHKFWIVPGSATTVTLTEPERPKPKSTESTAGSSTAGSTTATTNSPGDGTAPGSTTVGANPGAAKPAVEIASADGAKRPPTDLPQSPAPNASAKPGDAEKPKVELAGPDGAKPDGTKPSDDPATKPSTPTKTGTSSSAAPVQLHERRKLVGNGAVTQVDFSPDGTFVATVHDAGRNTEVRVWNTGTGKMERTLSPQSTFPPLVRMAKDNARLFHIAAGITQPSTITAWTWKNNRPLSMGQVGTPSGSRPGRVDQWLLSDDDQTAMLSMKPHNDNAPRNVGLLFWSFKTKKEIRYQAEPSADAVSHIALSPDGEIAAAAFWKSNRSDKQLSENVRVWDVKSKETLFSEKFERETERCLTLQFVDDGKKLVFAGPRSNEFHVVDIESRAKKTHTITPWSGDSRQALFVGGGLHGITRLQAARGSSELIVFGLAEAKILAWKNANERGVDLLALSNKGDLLASADADGNTILWDVEQP